MVVQQTTKTLFLFIFSVASCITTTIAQKNSTNYLCNPGNSNMSSNFQNSLAEGIGDVKSAAKSGLLFKYYSPLYDDYTRLVHVSYLCQSVALQNCYDCVSRAAKTAQSNCSYWSTEAVVYEEECTFRYSDKPFYGRFDNSSFYTELDDKPLNPNSVSRFAKALNETAKAIERNIRSSPNYLGVKFETEEDKVDDKTTIYAMGECTGDLYHEDCRLCIHECASKVVTEGKVGGRVMLPSCNFRYNTTPFYDNGPPPHSQARNKVDGKAAAAGSGAGVGGLLIGSALSWAYQKRKAMQASSGTPEDDEAGDEAPADDENHDPQADEETGAGLPPDSEAKDGSEQVNEEELKWRNRKQALKPSKGNKKNAAKKPPRR